MSFPLFMWAFAGFIGVVLMGLSIFFRIAQQNMSEQEKFECNLLNLGGIALMFLPLSIFVLIMFGFFRGILFAASEVKKLIGE